MLENLTSDPQWEVEAGGSLELTEPANSGFTEKSHLKKINWPVTEGNTRQRPLASIHTCTQTHKHIYIYTK